MKIQSKIKWYWVVTLLLTGIGFSHLSWMPSIEAQETSWVSRERIPGSHNDAATPYLVADQNRSVHAFFSQPLIEDDWLTAIYYSRWTLEQGWTDLVDIILPPFGRFAVVKGVVLDREGMMHLIFYGGDATNANIYYTRAPITRVGQAPAWSRLQVIGREAELGTASLAIDAQDNLIVLYSGRTVGSGMYATHSEDSGDTWSDPEPIFLTYDVGLFIWGVRFKLYSASQKLHAVWTVNTPIGQGQAIYYANMESNTLTWNEPVLLARGTSSQITEPAVIEHEGELIVIYLDWSDTPPRRKMLRSGDGGRTWSDPVAPFDTAGEYGEPDFAVDSAGILHLFLGDRARGLNVWHSVWKNNLWQEPEPVAPASEAQTYLVGPLTFHPWYPEAVVSQGNVILLAWETDPGAAQNGIWYSYLQLDTPELPVVPLPTQALPTPIQTPTASLTPVPNIESGLEPAVINVTDAPGSFLANNPAAPIVGGIIPAIILIAIILIRNFVFSNNRR